MDAYRILHIDDDADIREIVKYSLALDPEIAVKSCDGGMAALGEAATWSPDVILMDVMMPVIDGPQLLSHLRHDERTAGIPVVFLTARVQSGEVAHFMSLGAAGVLVKPFDPLTLAKSVRACTESQQPPA